MRLLRPVRALPLLPVLALAAALARPAAAQSKDAASATALFQEGRDAAKKGDYTTACLKMEESLRLDAAVGTLLNLADCQEHLGHLATAWQRFNQAVDKLPPADDRVASVKQRIAALEARLPRLTVSLAPGAPPDARVTRDGVELGRGSLDTALPVDPGAHEVVVTAPGRDARRFPVEVGEGRTERLVVEPGAPAGQGAVVTPPPPASSSGGPLRLAGIVVGGAGVITLGAAIATGLVLPSKQKTVDQSCGAAVHLPVNRCNAVGFDAAQSGKTLAAANTATWVAGGIAAAAGVALVVVGIVGDRKPVGPVQVGASLGLAGATIEGRFQ